MGTIDKINKIIDLFGAPLTPSEKNVDYIIDYFIPTITQEALANNLKAYALYIKTKDESLKPLFDPMYPLMNNYSNYLNGKSEYVIRKIGRRWWKYILPLIQNPEVIADKIATKKPEVGQMLNGVVGRLYMEYFAKRLTDFFHIWLWKFPRWHNGCGGLIRYGLVSKKGNIWGFYCRKCKTIIPDDQLEELTYTK
jgi:hypothetical protein